jgi:hypothetical protein
LTGNGKWTSKLKIQYLKQEPKKGDILKCKFNKTGQDLYARNQTLRQKIKENLNIWRNILCLQIGK